MMSHNNQEVFYGHPAEYYQNQVWGEDLRPVRLLEKAVLGPKGALD